MTPLRQNFFFLLKRTPLTLFLTAILFQLGQFEWLLPYTGDGHYTEELALKGWVVLMHSPLTTMIHKIFCTLLEPFGIRAWYAISISSAFAGALALQVLFVIRSHPVFLIVNIFSGSFLVFVGEVESYAWINLFLLLSFLGIERFLQNRWRLWPAAVFFFLACLFHMLAIFYLPAFFWLIRRRQDFHPLEFLVPMLTFFIAVVSLNFLLQSEGLDMDLGRLVPLFQINRKGQHFTLFSLAHLELLAYFHWKGSFLQQIPLELPLLILMRKRIDTEFKRCLLLCCIIGVGWTTIWHPDLGRLDWDLFSQMFIPIHLLLGILLTEWFQER